jgi:hypothetical protein
MRAIVDVDTKQQLDPLNVMNPGKICFDAAAAAEAEE